MMAEPPTMIVGGIPTFIFKAATKSAISAQRHDLIYPLSASGVHHFIGQHGFQHHGKLLGLTLRITGGCKPSRASGLLGMFDISFRLPSIVALEYRFRSVTIEPPSRGRIDEEECVPESGAECQDDAMVIRVSRLGIARQGAVRESGVFGSEKYQLVFPNGRQRGKTARRDSMSMSPIGAVSFVPVISIHGSETFPNAA